MADLIKTTVQGSAAPATSRQAQQIEQKRKRWASWNNELAFLAGNKAPNVACENVLAGNYPKLSPAPETTRKAADPLANAPAHIQSLAKRTGPEAGKLLMLIEERSKAEGGKPIDFTTADAAEVMGVSREKAEQILSNLLQKGLLTPRTGPVGAREGYVISASGL
jgi:hypothetical protein